MKESPRFMYIGIEISARCNARCPWCFTNKPGEERTHATKTMFMELDRFVGVIERLESLGFLEKKPLINLYSIGEPFLNRDLPTIIGYLTGKGLSFGISTNGSVPLFFEEGSDALRNLANLIISVPGFSQESYDRVHGFRFETMKANIAALVENFRKAGFRGDARLVYHVYQDNIGELLEAKAFAAEIGVDLYPYYAILYEYRYVRDFIKDTFSYELLKKASTELFLGKIERTISQRTPDYVCDFFNMLLIDADADLKTCCQIRKGDPGYSFGNLFELSAEQIMARRRSQPICTTECQPMGMDYYLSVYTPFELSLGKTDQTESGGKRLMELVRSNGSQEIVLFGAGRVGLKALEALQHEGVQVSCFADNSPLKVGTKVAGVEVIPPAQISERCREPLIIITTINHRQVTEQLLSLGLGDGHYFGPEEYQ